MSSSAADPAPTPDRLEQARLEKLAKIEALGVDPWGGRFDGHTSIGAARERAPAEPGIDTGRVRVAGRIMLRNNKGKLKFFHIQDATGRIQLMASRRDLPDQQWELIENLDLGDLVGADGPVRRTNTGEITVFLERLTLLTKSLAQPPEKFHGARDTEMLLRQRYIDLIYNEGVLDRMLLRTRIIESVRRTLARHRFVEVETPVLHAIAGGAAARPFVTHHNALGIDLYLRIALELHLKRLLVGGLERVYEIGRVFRNEGIDATHNPEFTMLEAYQAYGDYGTMMDLTEAIVVDAARVVLEHGSGSASTEPRRAPLGPGDSRLVLPWGEAQIDFTPPWPRVTYGELFRQHVGCELRDEAAVRGRAREEFGGYRPDPAVPAAHTAAPPGPQPLDPETAHPDVLANELFERHVEPRLTGPVFVLDYPASICPLTKRNRSDAYVAERFELFIQGMELANAYTELNDPRLQEELFRTQLAGLSEDESMAKMDHDFIRALKVGMPPAGGLGIGIDRLVMLLTGSRSIRDVIFFPLLRPERDDE